MKTRTFILALLALTLTLSCEKEAPSSLRSEISSEVDAPNYPWALRDISDQAIAASGPSYSVNAGFEPATRTSLQMNQAQTNAQVVWNKGDQYFMVAPASGGGYYSMIFTTQQEGQNYASFTSSGYVDQSKVSDAHCLYPYRSDIKAGTYGDQWIFGLNLPHQQTAVSGGVAPGLLLSYAHVSSTTAEPHFYNIPALVRFRLSGSLVSSISQITLRGGSAIAGDFVVMKGSDDKPEVTTQIAFLGTSSANTVVLSGNFVAGTDYYFAILPGDFSHMTLVFSDGESSTTKISSGKISCKRSQIVDLGTIDVGSAFTDGEQPDPAVLYMQATKGTKPVSIAVIPEAFTSAQLSTYNSLARTAVDALFNTEPYKTYKDYFNVWILSVASNESGASVTDGVGNVTTAHDTYFGAKWGESSYGDMAADASAVYSFVSDVCPDITNGTHTIDDVAIMMIINESRYGGICHVTSNGRCYAMCPYFKNGEMVAWSYPSSEAASVSDPSAGSVSLSNDYIIENGLRNTGDWCNTVVHEFGGHAFGRLSDEYWSIGSTAPNTVDEHNWSPLPYGLNVSGDYNNPTWKEDLLNRKADLVAINPAYDRIGVFHGGGTYMYNRWRSEKISCMIDNRFYFSTWQRELIVKRIIELAGETFSFADFLAKDVPEDPVRDKKNAPRKPWDDFPVQVYPPFAPPVLTELPQ